MIGDAGIAGKAGCRKLVVTGATGYIGSRVVGHLARSGEAVVAVVRDVAKGKTQLPFGPELRVADYDDRSALLTVFQDATDVLIIPGDGDANALTRQLSTLITSARFVGVPRLVLLSIVDVAEISPFYFASAYRKAERMLWDACATWTVLRCSLYADLVWRHCVLPATETGFVSVPAGNAKLCLVSRDDVASAAAAAIVRLNKLPGETISLTGPEALSFADITCSANKALDSCLAYQSCQAADELRRLRAEVVPPWPDAFASLFASVRQGRFALVSDGFERLTGQAPESWMDFLSRQRVDRGY